MKIFEGKMSFFVLAIENNKKYSNILFINCKNKIKQRGVVE